MAGGQARFAKGAGSSLTQGHSQPKEERIFNLLHVKIDQRCVSDNDIMMIVKWCQFPLGGGGGLI